MVAAKKILVVEDHEDIRHLVRHALAEEGYSVRDVGTGEDAWHAIHRDPPALIVLDLMLPGLSGLEICRMLRADDSLPRIPVVILSIRGSEDDKIVGFASGADDYVTKPFSTRELVARVKAVLRRERTPDSERPHRIYERGCLRIDYDTYQASLDGRQLALSIGMLKLLMYFVEHPNRVLGRDQLLDSLWAGDSDVSPRAVDIQVKRLRLHIERNPRKPELIVTVRRVGYKFDEAALDGRKPAARTR